MGDIVIFTDGACSGNPGPGGWCAIVALPDGFVRELGGGHPQTTNNRMEMTGVIKALESIADRLEPALVCTDSTYVIDGITSWIKGWKSRGWLNKAGEPVANKDLWLQMDALVHARRGLQWRYVRGHSGSEGNERCDVIAVGFSKRREVDLYEGPMQGYTVSLLAPMPEAAKVRSSNGTRGAKKTGGLYLSYLDGKLERHTTWADCEARVKGRPARFKKVSGPDEEAATLRSWGLS